MIPYSVLCLLSRSTVSPLSFFPPVPLPSHSSFCNSCVRSPARSYPPPPLPLAASLRLTSPAPSQVFLFISGVARVPRLRNPRSLRPPCAHAALCSRLVACHRSKGAIAFQHPNPSKSFLLKAFQKLPPRFLLLSMETTPVQRSRSGHFPSPREILIASPYLSLLTMRRYLDRSSGIRESG